MSNAEKFLLIVLGALLTILLFVAVGFGVGAVAWVDNINATESHCVALGEALYCRVEDVPMYATTSYSNEQWEDGSGRWVIDYCLAGSQCED